MLSGLADVIKKAEDHLHNEFNKLQVGRANPAIVEGVTVEAYGMTQPLKNVANVAVMDSQTLSIQPWDKGMMADIEKGIITANLGLNPNNNGESILINIPPLTEERRKELTKVAKWMAEDGKVAVRNIRGDFHKKIQRAEQEKEITEDEAKNLQIDLQEAIDTANKTIDDMLAHKQADIMKV